MRRSIIATKQKEKMYSVMKERCCGHPFLPLKLWQIMGDGKANQGMGHIVQPSGGNNLALSVIF